MVLSVLVTLSFQLLGISSLNLEDWEKRLEPKDPRTCSKALQEISLKPDVAVQHLDTIIDLLADKRCGGAAMMCLDALVETNATVLRRLESTLASGADQVHERLARPLGTAVAAGNPRTRDLLIDSLGSTENVVVTISLRALTSAPKVLDEVWPKFLSLVTNPELCVAATTALLEADFDPKPVALMVRENLDAEPPVLPVMLILAHEVSHDVDLVSLPAAVKECLRSDDFELRLIAIDLLLKCIDRMPPEWIGELDNGLSESHRVLTSLILQLLFKLGPDQWTGSIEKQLKGFLRHKSPNFRAMGAAGLLAQGSEVERAMKVIARALQHPQPEERSNVLDDLRLIGCFHSDLVKIVLESLQDDDPGVQLSALGWLKSFGPSNEVDRALRNMAHDTSQELRMDAMDTLIGRESFNEIDHPSYLTLLDFDHNGFHVALERIPLEMSGESVDSAIVRGMGMEDRRTRFAAAKAATRRGLHQESARDIFIEVVASVRGAYGINFGRVSPPLMRLRRAVFNRHDGGDKIEALNALGRMGPAASKARQTIEAAIEGFDVEVRRAAKNALENIGVS